MTQSYVADGTVPIGPLPPNECADRFGRERGGGERDRTDDPLLAKQVLSQLSYTPKWPHSGCGWWVWLDSNQRPPPYQDGALTD